MSIDETKKLLKKLQGKKTILMIWNLLVREDKKKQKKKKRKKRNLENLVSTINVLKKLENVKD